MKSVRLPSVKCLFAGWVFGWVTAIYLPSFSIAVLSLSPLATGDNLFLDAFAVADEVSPAAKLAFAILFGGFLLIARLAGAHRWLIDAALGVVSMLLVVAFLPEQSSRGFGVGLNGTRFDMLPTLIYVVGGFLSGVVFSFSAARCLARSQRPSTHQSAED